MAIMDTGLVLASASPRRRELLEMLGVKKLRVVPAQGEEHLPPGLPPDETVKVLALAKAREAAAKCGDAVPVVAADTIVYAGGEILGKPRDKAEAASMLRRLRGGGHGVFTGVAVLANGEALVEAEETLVFFRDMSESEILAYVETGEPLDKAGAYGAQGIGSLFIDRIEGDFFNVVGLPLCRLGRMLERIGTKLI